MAVGVARLPLIFSLLLPPETPLPFAKPLTSTCLDPALVSGGDGIRLAKASRGTGGVLAVTNGFFLCNLTLFGLIVFLYHHLSFERGAGFAFHALHKRTE